MTSRTLVFLSVALLTAGAAAAQNGRGDRARGDRSRPDTFTDWTREGFASVDRNEDGHISRKEWRWSREAFDEHDRNGDGQLSRREFTATVEQRGRSGQRPRSDQRSAAFRAGFERGQQEGRAAGREDRERHQGWDLEGQRELETADSGYSPGVGSRSEYQAGYRDGFRQAYRDGYGR